MKPDRILSGNFLKSQYASVISTLADFMVTLFLTQVVGFWYLLSSFIGTLLGGCINFSLGRNWVYRVKNGDTISQITRYIIVWSGSLIFNTFGVFFLTDVLSIHYILSKSIIAVLAGVGFNFYFQKSFVFRT